MKLFLAAAFTERARMRAIRDKVLRPLGVEVTSRWIDLIDVDDTSPSRLVASGTDNLYDIRRADTFVLFTTPASTAGGAHLETGYAWLLGIPILVVGPPVNLYHHHPRIHAVLPSLGELCRWLRERT